RAAGHGPLRPSRDGSRFPGFLQHDGRDRRAREGTAQGTRGSRGMSDLRDLYQEVILDHSKRPRNFRELPEANYRADGYNPLCGDRATVYVRLDGDIVTDVSFKGSGCSINTASSSMMTESIKGKSRAEVERLFTRFHDLVTASPVFFNDTATP